MAKYEAVLGGNFNTILSEIDRAVNEGSLSASLEDESSFCSGDMRCAVRVYERYSMLGQNRVSLNVTMVESGGRIFFTAIASGGSQAVLFKVNTIGESSFLDTIIDAVEQFRV